MKQAKHAQNQLPPQDEIDAIVARAEAIIGYEFKDKALLARALTHPSAVEADTVALSYERLEFLGDAYLGIIIAEKIYSDFPDLDEGALTRMKSAVVSGTPLSKISEDLGLGELIIFGESERHTGKRGLHSALENVYESLVAALALDGGLDVARQWVFRTMKGMISADLALVKLNPKSSLQEVLQSNHKVPTYKLVDTQGPSHDRTFFVEAYCEDELLGSGVGRSKKEAEMAAAEQALATLEKRG